MLVSHASRQAAIYTLLMPKYVYVQIQGVEAPAKIAADKVEKRMSDSTLVVKNGDEQVGSSSWAVFKVGGYRTK